MPHKYQPSQTLWERGFTAPMDITPPATSKSPKELEKVKHCQRHTYTNLLKLSGDKDLLHLWISPYEWPPPQVLEKVEHCPHHTYTSLLKLSGIEDLLQLWISPHQQQPLKVLRCFRRLSIVHAIQIPTFLNSPGKRIYCTYGYHVTSGHLMRCLKMLSIVHDTQNTSLKPLEKNITPMDFTSQCL